MVDPVLVPKKPSLELESIHVPHFDAFVVTGSEKCLAITEELD